MFGKKFWKNNRGLTLIELITAVAILSIIAGTIGGAMVVATNSYRQSTVESALQQESQFTANAIEALIVDVTKSVTFDGTMMTIENEDGSYVISYNDVEHTLRYTEFLADGTPVEPENELLADHVTGFNVNADDFDVSRNVRIVITMENQESSYTTTYNITSRNNPGNAGSVDVSATIICMDRVVLEPSQEYILPVSTVGAATGIGCAISDDSPMSAGTSAVPVEGGIKIILGSDEKGGADQKLNLAIITDRNGTDGNPLDTKNVEVCVRRVTNIHIQEDSVETNGASSKSSEGVVYTLSVPNGNYEGNYLDKVVAAAYDQLDYVDPRTCVWSFESSNGNWQEYIDVNEAWATLHQGYIQFRLKKDLPSGTILSIKATNLHSRGKEPDVSGTPQNMNKTGVPYDGNASGEVFDVYTIETQNDSYIARGTEVDIFPWGNDATQDQIKAKMGIPQGANIQQQAILCRYISTDGTDRSPDDSNWNWYRMSTTGMTLPRVEFKKADFVGPDTKLCPLYMKDYTLQVWIVLGYQYNNVFYWSHCPEGFNMPNNSKTPVTLHPEATLSPADRDHIFEFPMTSFKIKLTGAKDMTDAQFRSYVTANDLGFGTVSNPVPVKFSNWMYSFEVSADLYGAASERNELESLFAEAKVYRYDNGNWTLAPNGFSFDKSISQKVAHLTGGATDNYAKFGFSLRKNTFVTSGKIYKIVLDEFHGNYSRGNAMVTGFEHYNNAPGKGEFIIKTVN